MKSGIKKKILSGIAVLAVSASAVAGAVAYVNFSKNGNSYVSSETDLSANVIATAWGGAQQKGGGKTYYVSPTGTGDEYTSENPGSLAALLHDEDATILTSPVGPGDTVIVKAGEYNLDNSDGTNSTPTKDDNLSATAGLVIRKSGTYDNYIKIIAEEGTTPVLKFYKQSFGPRGVQIYGNYVYWSGINIEGAGDNGMFIGGSYNTIENCEFSFNRDTGLQLGRAMGDYSSIRQWPNYNLIKNCTSHNNYDNESAGENADGFAAKLTVGYGNVFDGCIAYRNSDDGWDLYAKNDSGNIGTVVLYNCVAFENGFIESTQNVYNARFPDGAKNASKLEDATAYGEKYITANGDGNGFKLGGENMEADVYMFNCLAFHNRLHGFTDNSNPGVITLKNCTSYDNSRLVSEATGEVINMSNGDSSSDWSSNIDLSRHENSYNIIENTLSVKGVLSEQIESDEYRGSVRNSILTRGNEASSRKYYKIEGTLDADAKNGITGEETTALDAATIFAQLPVENGGTAVAKGGAPSTYNISGKDSYSQPQPIHKKLRNTDGSVNMGNILKIKDRGSFITDVEIGADLSKSSQSDYQKFEADNPYSEISKENQAIVERAKNALLIPVDEEAVYQDFEVPINMGGIIGDDKNNITVSWTADNTTVLKIDASNEKASISQVKTIPVIVNRDPEEDKHVKLTATITFGTGADQATVTKEFNITVIKNEYKLGKLIATGADGNVIPDGTDVIIDNYSIFKEPTITVENGYDYNGKLLPSDKYDLSAKYVYQLNTNSPEFEVKGYSASHAGVFTITYTAELKSDNTKASMTIRVFNASPDATIDFSTPEGAEKPVSTVSVYRDGFRIIGDVSSPKGKIYTVVSQNALTDITKANIKTYQGVDVQDFNGTSINMTYENANNAGYHIYYALGNNNGDVTSSEVYSAEVKLVNISTKEDFRKIAGGALIGEEDASTTIYKLTEDLDFAETEWAKWTSSAKAFKGLFNGDGHTIKNITLKTGMDSSAGSNASNVFYRVDGGTIMNVKFEDIDLEGYRVVAIIGTCYGGYFYNIAMKNINVSGNQRVAALIGSVGETEKVPVSIDQVSLVNDLQFTENPLHEFTTTNPHMIKATESDSRSGGLIGLVQCEKSDAIGSQIYISNCAVVTNAQVYSDFGGMVGCYEDQDASYVLNITDCLFHGNIRATNGVRASATYGYHKGGLSKITIDGFIASIPTFYANKINTVETPQKNASALAGQWSGENTTISNCATIGASIYENAANYTNITPYDPSSVAPQIATYACHFDMEKRWEYNYEQDKTDKLAAPYLTLKFL